MRLTTQPTNPMAGDPGQLVWALCKVTAGRFAVSGGPGSPLPRAARSQAEISLGWRLLIFSFFGFLKKRWGSIPHGVREGGGVYHNAAAAEPQRVRLWAPSLKPISGISPGRKTRPIFHRLAGASTRKWATRAERGGRDPTPTEVDC